MLGVITVRTEANCELHVRRSSRSPHVQLAQQTNSDMTSRQTQIFNGRSSTIPLHLGFSTSKDLGPHSWKLTTNVNKFTYYSIISPNKYADLLCFTTYSLKIFTNNLSSKKFVSTLFKAITLWPICTRVAQNAPVEGGNRMLIVGR